MSTIIFSTPIITRTTTSMNSVLPPLSPLRSSENSISRYRVYASWCYKELSPNVSVSNWIGCYNPTNNTWTRVTYIPGLYDNHVLKDFAMVSIKNVIYIIGGRLCRKERALDGSNDFIEINKEVRPTVLRYDVISEQWSECASLNMPRYAFACDVCDGKIYIAGGHSILVRAKGISSAEVYDPSRDEWTSLPDMSTLRYKCVGVTWQGKIHVIGGFAERGISDRIVPYVDRSSADVYNADAKRWDLKVGMWQLDCPPNQIVAVDGKLFSSGDCFKAWKGHIEAYDGDLNIWYMVDGSQRKSLISSNYHCDDSNEENLSQIQRLYLTMVPLGKFLYFLTGYRTARDSSSTISVVHRFDTSATRDAWRSFEPIVEDGERELCSHACAIQLP